MSASTVAVVLVVVALGALAGVFVRNKAADASPRNKAIWSMAAWSVTIIVGLAIWLIARSQISS